MHPAAEDTEGQGAPAVPGRFVPPVEFAVYGLDESWAGPRALDTFRGIVGEPPSELWLGHQTPDQRAGIRIGSLARPKAPPLTDDDEPVVAAAGSGAGSLVDLTIPLGPLPSRTRGLVGLLSDHARARARAHASWPEVAWVVNGEPVRARVWHFAGAWTGLTTDLPDVFVVAVGVGVHPDGLRVRRIKDGAEYGFDLARPLDRVLPGAEHRECVETILRKPNRHGYLPEQLALLAPGSG